MSQTFNVITFKMNGQTFHHELPAYVETIAQFKNNLITDETPYNFSNLLVCYLHQGHDVVPYDDELINFDLKYYVIIRPIECDEHLPDNNNYQSHPLILNFDDSDDSDDEDEDDGDADDNEDEDEDDSDSDSDSDMPRVGLI